MPNPPDLALGDVDPEVVNKFLHDEASGVAPQPVVDFVNRRRAEGHPAFPPPLIKSPEAAAQFQNAPGPIPQPQMSTKDKFLAAIPDALEWMKSTAKSFADPEVIGGIAGGTVGEAA